MSDDKKNRKLTAEDILMEFKDKLSGETPSKSEASPPDILIGDDEDDAARRGLASSSRRGGRTRNGRSAVKSLWIGLDAFNLLGISNVNSYYWVTDITDTQYAVPNYLTGRQINARIAIKF